MAHGVSSSQHIGAPFYWYGLTGITMSSNENLFHVTGSLCGKFTGRRWIPLMKFSDVDVIFDLHLNKRMGKQS